MMLYFGYSPFHYIATNYYDANNHIFHTHLVHLMTVLFGDDNAIAIRMPTFIAGVATLGMVGLLARKLFRSQSVAWIAMLMLAVNPAHIHYSQTARGYSLIIFFSVVMVLALLHLLENKPSRGWGVTFVVCGVLSVYTLPTNVYFLLVLGVWTFSLLLIPKASQAFQMSDSDRRKKLRLFAALGVSMLVLLALVYWPIADQVIQTAKDHPLLTFDTKTTSFIKLVPGILQKIFPGLYLITLPLILAGFYSLAKIRFPLAALFLLIFFLPLSIPLVTGVGGYPRNYLFHLPFLVLLLAGGMVLPSEWIAEKLRQGWARPIVLSALTLGCVLVSVKWLWFDYYPSIRVPDGNLYKQKVKENSGKNDLLVIADSRHYLYARSLLKENLREIIRTNKLTGIKMITPSSFDLTTLKLPTQRGGYPFLKDLPLINSFNPQDVSGGKSILHLTGNRSISPLPEDFAMNADWAIVRGKGEIRQETRHKFSGKGSLWGRASKEQDMLLQAKLPEVIAIQKTSLIVMIWTHHSDVQRQIIYRPALSATVNMDGKQAMAQFLLGTLNEGIHIHLSQGEGSFFSKDWSTKMSLGVISPGSYAMQMALLFPAGVPVLYDSFRLFFIELEETALRPPL